MSRRAFARPALRPYLPNRAHLRRILHGAIILARIAGRAGLGALRRATAPPAPEKQEQASNAKEKQGQPEKPEGKKPKKPSTADTLERAGAGSLIVVISGIVVGGAVRAAWPHVALYAPIPCGVLVCGLIAAAWAVGPPPPAKPHQPATAPTPAPAPEDLLARDRAAMLTLLDAATRGRNGIHLDPLYELTSQHPLFGPVPRARLGALLAGLGVPTVRSLSVDGVEGRTGVRRSAVEELLALPHPNTPGGPSRAAESVSDQQVSGDLSGGSQSPLGTGLGSP